jgi:ribosome biogenesis GTPase
MLSIQFETLRRIGFTNAFSTQLAGLPEKPHAHLMRIIDVHKDWLTVHNGEHSFSARALPRLINAMAEQGLHLAVGDWIVAENSALNEWWITSRLSPSNHLSRRSFDGRRQSVASNIDTALLVMGLDHDFNLRRLERYIAMVAAAGISPVVVLTKASSVFATVIPSLPSMHRIKRQHSNWPRGCIADKPYACWVRPAPVNPP